MKRNIISILFLTLICFYSYAQFTPDAGANTQLTDLSGEQAIPKIAVCTDGSMYVSWFSNESGNYNMRLQYLDVNGNEQWENNGILVSDQPQMSWLTDYALTTDSYNHAIVTFQDIREVDNNPVGYRISPTGDFVWGDNGILLANNANFDPSPKVCATEAGNIVFTWQSSGDISDVRLQKVSPAGDLLWDDGIILTEAGVQYTAPYVKPAGEDHVYLIWHKETGPFYAPNRGLYVQKLNIDGSFMWPDAVEIYAPVPAGPVVYLKMNEDNQGGLVFSWYGNDVGTHFNAWVQHMNADGALLMAANGVVVSTSQQRMHMYPAPAFVPETGEIVVFFSEQDLNQNQRGLYAQKFDAQGNRQWTDDGKTLIPLSNNDYSLPDAGGYMDKAICVYGAAEFGNSADEKVQAVMLDTDGNYVWQEEFIDMSTVQSQKIHRVMSSFHSNQWVAVWGDERNGNRDIYAQNIHPDGSLGPGTQGEGKIQGFVRDAFTNIAIDEATITATSADDNYQTVETPFGSHFSFMVPAGIYTVSCQAAGYQIAEFSNVVVVENNNTHLTFYLTPTENITGLSGIIPETAQIYPNPFSDVLNISLPGNEYSILSVEISDVRGSILKSVRPAEDTRQGFLQMNTSDLKKGIYFYNIKTTGKSLSGKITRY
jgi:hypothetical protein